MRIFPTTIKRTTVIVGGGGPNPSDAFSLGFTFPESNLVPSDAALFALLFPELNAALSDAASMRLSLADVNGALTDLLLRLGIGVADTNAALTDALSLAIQFADTNPALFDLIFRLVLSGFGDTSAAPTDNLLRLGFQFAEANAAITDATTLLLRAAYAETIAAMTEALALRVQGFGDTFSAPTDLRTAQLVWRQGATTATSGGSAWTNPANATGIKNSVNATAADSSAIAAWTSTLTLDPYPDAPADLQTWTITKVEVVEYASYTPGTLPAEGSWKLSMRLGAGTYVDLESLNTVFNVLAAGRVFDVTAIKPGGGAWTWTDINNLNTRVTYNSALVETSSCAVDAVEVLVTATKSPL